MSQVLGKLLLVLEAQTSGFQKGLQDAKRMSFDSAEGMIDSFKRVAEQLGRLKFSNDKELKRSFEIVGGVAAATAVGIVAATAAITKSTAMQAAEMSKLAQSYGLSIEAVSAFRVASKLTDVSMETLTMGMGKLAKSAGQVAQTGQSTGGAFKSLDISVTDGQRHLRPMADLLLDVSDKMSKLGDGTGKTVLAQQLFGKSGAAMIPFLNRGKEGIKEMMELSDQLGLTWSEKDAKAAEQFKDQIEILELRGTAFKENYAKGVLPALDQIADAFTRADKNGGSFAKTLGETVGAALKTIVGLVHDAAIGFDIMLLKLQQFGSSKYASIAGMGVRVLTGADIGLNGGGRDAAATDPAAQIEELLKQSEKFHANLDGLPTLLGGGGKGKDPKFPAAAVEDLSKALDALLEKTRTLTNSAEHDPIETMRSNLEKLRQQLIAFRTEHPERIWSDINAAIQKVTKAEEDLTSKQRVAMLQFQQQGHQRMFEALGEVIGKTLDVPGNIQNQKKLADALNDVNNRNARALQIYEETKTPLEHYNDQVRELSTLWRAGSVSSVTYLKRLEDINEQLREQQRREAEMKASRSAQSGGIGAGIRAGADIYKLNTPTLGTQAMEHTLQVLHQMQGAMSNAFSQMIMGTKSVGAAFAEMGRSMLESVVTACTEMIAQWLMTHVIMAAIDKIFGSSLVNESDAKKKKAINADLASSAAALAAANTLAYTSALYPPPVPEALSMMAFAIGETYAAVASASGGWGEVDRDQMAMVHKKEMILPASIADTVRGLASVAPTFGNGYLPRSGSESYGGGGGFGMNNTFHQYGTDPKAVAREVGSVVSAKMQRMMKGKLVRV